MGKLKTNSRKVFCRVLPLLAALILILGSCLTVRAAEDVNINTVIANLENRSGFKQYEYNLLVDAGYYYFFITSTSPCTVYNDNLQLYIEFEPNWGYGYYYFDNNFNVYQYNQNNDTRANRLTLNNYKYLDSSSTEPFSLTEFQDSIIECDYVILDYNDNVVFPEPVHPILQEAAQAIVPEEVMKETIGLLPLLIPFLVGLVGFWKGLQFLSQILRKA